MNNNKSFNGPGIKCPTDTGMIPISSTLWSKNVAPMINAHSPQRTRSMPCGLAGKLVKVAKQGGFKYAFVNEAGERVDFIDGVKPAVPPSASSNPVSFTKQGSGSLKSPAHLNNAPGSTNNTPGSTKEGGTGNYKLSPTCDLSTAILLTPEQWHSMRRTASHMLPNQPCIALSSSSIHSQTSLRQNLIEMEQLQADMDCIANQLETEVNTNPGSPKGQSAAHPKPALSSTQHSAPAPRPPSHHQSSGTSSHPTSTEGVDSTLAQAQRNSDSADQQLASAAHNLAHGSPQELSVQGELESSFLNQQSQYLHMFAWFGLLVAAMYYITLSQTFSQDTRTIVLGLCILILVIVACSWLWNNLNISFGH